MLGECTPRDDTTDSWYAKATVRHTPRIFAPSGTNTELVYPTARSFIVDHPIVRSKGPDVRSFILAQAAYQFLYNIALMETKLVIRASLAVLHRNADGIDDQHKLDALTVVIDEGYHAHVALDYILQFKQQSGIAPVHPPESTQKIDAVERAAAVLPVELHPDFELLAVTLAENVVTEEVANMGREKDVVKSFATVMKDHVRDEGRHSSYFAELMKARWPHLSEDTQMQLGAALPHFLEDYLHVDPERHAERQVLQACGLLPDEIGPVLADSEQAFTDYHTQARQKTTSRLLRLIRQIGVLDVETNRQLFAERGYAI
ncbi:diiron oxygenase [Caldimonas brevitalea]|uniref:Para-aminobenzoate N-oxygenase AurF n=1 Tax=Caldimonas brevitalea TaxID=413882 RepID=A0A0G3BRS0_9BURK|nr:diiron oxygenase [Caldimonas brevitalea]AKJ30076.1 hypothetical protein AAW51_3385 [Caldimonas brevitalea]